MLNVQVPLFKQYLIALREEDGTHCVQHRRNASGHMKGMKICRFMAAKIRKIYFFAITTTVGFIGYRPK